MKILLPQISKFDIYIYIYISTPQIYLNFLNDFYKISTIYAIFHSIFHTNFKFFLKNLTNSTNLAKNFQNKILYFIKKFIFFPNFAFKILKILNNSTQGVPNGHYKIRGGGDQNRR